MACHDLQQALISGSRNTYLKPWWAHSNQRLHPGKKVRSLSFNVWHSRYREGRRRPVRAVVLFSLVFFDVSYLAYYYFRVETGSTLTDFFYVWWFIQIDCYRQNHFPTNATTQTLPRFFLLGRYFFLIHHFCFDALRIAAFLPKTSYKHVLNCLLLPPREWFASMSDLKKFCAQLQQTEYTWRCLRSCINTMWIIILLCWAPHAVWVVGIIGNNSSTWCSHL